MPLDEKERNYLENQSLTRKHKMTHQWGCNRTRPTSASMINAKETTIIYVPPENSNYSRISKFDDIEDNFFDLRYKKEDCDKFISFTGMLNAKTGNQNDSLKVSDHGNEFLVRKCLLTAVISNRTKLMLLELLTTTE